MISNGGWQWSASTGTDSQPYFRVFNPLLQAERYDPDAKYIKEYVNELSCLSNPKAVHDPHKVLAPAVFKKLGYPAPIVDHKTASKSIIALFKAATSSV
jgi:deoxyribodipyrimidine photo-lyase